MPKLRRQENKYEKLQILLTGKMHVLDLEASQLAERAGLSPYLVRRRFAHPDEITLDELRKLKHGLDLSAEEIREAIPMT